MPDESNSDRSVVTPIRCILSDVDGVMTDGRIIYDSAGAETKQFNVKDGLGIKSWMQAGFQFGIITARTSEMVDRRAKELGINHISQGKGEKLARAEVIIDQWGIDFSEVCYLGDDLPDLSVMKRVGLSVAPNDAATDILEMADWVMKRPGGHGVVREAVERIMRAKGLWNTGGGQA